MKNSVNDDGFRFDRIENTKGKPGNEDAAKRAELHRTRLWVASDEGNRGIDTADEMERCTRAATLVPQPGLRHIVLRTSAYDERVGH